METLDQFHEFMHAVLEDAARADEMLLADPSLIRLRNGIGETALHYLAIEDQIQSVCFLLDRGSDINSRDYFDSTPLISASGLGYLEMTRLLIARGADLEAMNKNNDSALTAAISSSCFTPDLLRLLIDSGADVHAEHEMGRNVLYRAVDGKNEIAVDALFIAGAKLDSGPDDDMRLESLLFSGISVSMFVRLVEHGLDIQQIDAMGRTLLHVAASAANLPVVKFLIEHGADASARDDLGETPIFAAKRLAAHQAMTSSEGITPPLPEELNDQYFQIARGFRAERSRNLHMTIRFLQQVTPIWDQPEPDS